MINLNMGYYSMELSEESKALCVMTLPWGLYQYDALPQGILNQPLIFFRKEIGILFMLLKF
jgi:hypothetical protein